MNKHIDNERGIALLMAIIAIVVVGGLLIGVANTARLESRQAQNTGAMAADPSKETSLSSRTLSRTNVREL